MGCSPHWYREKEWGSGEKGEQPAGVTTGPLSAEGRTGEKNAGQDQTRPQYRTLSL
jgi:hypothetical protein